MARLTTVRLPAVLAVTMAVCLGLTQGTNFLQFTLDALLKRFNLNEFSRFPRLTGGTQVNGCDFPGVVAVTSNTKVVCNGVHKAGSIRVPNDCAELMAYLSKNGRALTIYGEDGTATANIAEKTAIATDNGDGTSTFSLSSPFPGTICPSNDYVQYDASMSIDLATCKVVSYGGNSTKLYTYDGTLRSTPLLDNPLQSCCSYILPNLESTATIGTLDSGNPQYYTCAKIDQGICNGDTGAPIYCLDPISEELVVVGMTATAKCNAGGETFVAIDLTNQSLNGFSSNQ